MKCAKSPTAPARAIKTQNLPKPLNPVPFGSLPNSQAAAAGLQRGEVIYQVGQYSVNSAADLEKVLSGVQKGDEVPMTVGSIPRRGRSLARNISTVAVTAS